MDRINRLLRAACTVLTAALMAGCTAYLAVRAPGFELSWLPVYGLALAAACIVQLGRRGTAWAVGAAAVLALAFVGMLAACALDIGAAIRGISEAGSRADFSAYASAGRGMALVLALMLGALFALLVQNSACAPFALMVLLAAVICAPAVNENISLWSVLPGLAAGVAAFGVSGDSRSDGIRPVLLIPALVLSLLALAFSPAAYTTWAPMEELAQRVRSIVEDYTRFTEERLAFSINEKGYDRAGMIGEQVVAMLGGPADPTEDAVMRVKTDVDVLLRGTIKRSYTTYSWVDDQPKARYLYYDFTHRGVRSDVFNAGAADDISGFSLHSGSVEMLQDGTSTLFVPGHMAQFSMNLEDAVYYNTAGELFLTREVEAGDGYSFSFRMPESNDALINACAKRADVQDERYAAAQADYTALPEGIDSKVYALAVEITKDTSNAAQKAISIQDYLAKNYRYTLSGGYPDGNRDFVSWFLLESKEGYCSYFASAMTVLCRIAGLPARYIEGYYVQAQPGGETIVTGKNAHAWVEVYLNGLGWVAFDPTARTVEQQSDDPPQSGYSDHAAEDEAGRENPFGGDIGDQPTPTPEPDPGSDPDPTPDAGNGGMNNPDNEPDSRNDPQQDDSDNSDAPDEPDSPEDPDSPPDENKNRVWLWILLAVIVLLALIALAVLWVRRRLAVTDPIRLCATLRSGSMAAMVLYRAILTLLAQTGMVPLGGEAPQAFAQRACMNMNNPAYERFVAGVVRSRYSGKGVSRDTLEAGKQAYEAFLNGMRRGERLRFHIRRVFHGLGSFENIP